QHRRAVFSKIVITLWRGQLIEGELTRSIYASAGPLSTIIRSALCVPTANHGVPRYESATTHAAAVNARVITTSPHWNALRGVPAAIRGNHTNSANRPICNAEK